MEQEQLEEDANMKKGIIYIGILTTIVVLTGCPGAIDAIAWKNLGHGYIYHEPAGQPFIEKENSGKGIPGWIFAYDYNNEFIIALEKDIELSEKKREELIVSGDFYDYVLQNGYSKYWIIAHVNDSIYGPFSREEYLKKRKEIGVPQGLKLKEE